jgi:putative membrane protein
MRFEMIPSTGVPAGASAALGFALALLIGFRVNQAYDRWWEARKLWGTLVNSSRNLSVKIRDLVGADAADRKEARDLIVAFSTGLKDHLRDEGDLAKLPGFSEANAKPVHLPTYIVRRIYALIAKWERQGELSVLQGLAVDAEARLLLDVCGACERIKNTLMSVSWRFLTRQLLLISLLLLPWGFVETFGVWTILLSIMTAYALVAGEAIAAYVEEPFGTGEDHLDLEGMADAIDRSVSEVLLTDSK